MNGKTGYAFRIVLGGYLAYLGIRMLIQMADERPGNMVFMSVMAVIFIVIGGGYAVYSLKKVWEIRKEEKGMAAAAEEETEPEDADVRPNTDVRPIDVRGADEVPEEKTEAVAEEPDGEMEQTAEGQEEEIENDYEEK